MAKLFLASSSPRRQELLTQIGVAFEQIGSNIDETPLPNEKPEAYVLRMAEEKALAGFQGLADKPNAVVLAADTSVICAGDILGKPEDKAHFEQMMQQLAANKHQVMTAIAIKSDKKLLSKLVVTDVEFLSLSEQQIDDYWHSSEPQDKAGGYGIQGLGAVLVKSITGSYSNVVGLPLAETAELLGQFDISVWQSE